MDQVLNAKSKRKLLLIFSLFLYSIYLNGQTLVPFNLSDPYNFSQKDVVGFCYVDSTTLEKKMFNKLALEECTFFNNRGFAFVQTSDFRLFIIDKNFKSLYWTFYTTDNQIEIKPKYNNDFSDFIFYINYRDVSFDASTPWKKNIKMRNSVFSDRLIDLEFSDLGAYNEGFFSFAQDRGGQKKWGFIDATTGNIIVDALYDEVRYFHNNYAAVKSPLGWGFVNRYGDEVISAIYPDVSDFYGSNAFVTLENKSTRTKNVFLIDSLGKKRIFVANDFNYWKWRPIPPSKKFLLEYSAKTGTATLMNTAGQKSTVTFPSKRFSIEYCDSFFIFYDPWTSVYNKSVHSAEIYNSNGKVIVPLHKYSQVKTISDGLFLVEKNGAWGYINHKGVEVIPLKYHEARSFVNGIAVVRSLKGYTLINKKGKELVPHFPNLDNRIKISPLRNGFIEFSVEGYRYFKHYYDLNGKKYTE
jgi:hypothetical protein